MGIHTHMDTTAGHTWGLVRFSIHLNWDKLKVIKNLKILTCPIQFCCRRDMKHSYTQADGRHWLVWPLKEGWVSQGENEGQKRFILVSPTLKVWLISLLLPSALHTEMKSLSGAKRWQSIPGIWLQQQYPILRYGTDPWAIFRGFLLKNAVFFLHPEWWSLQIREFNFYTTPEKLWLREESFALLKGWVAHRPRS